MALLNFVCAIALFRWKKWGFWGLCVTVVIGVVYNLGMGAEIRSAFGGLIWIGILYGVLHLGKENKGWLKLE